MSNDKIKLEFGRQSEDERFEATDPAGDSNSSSSTKAEPRRRASRAGTRSVATLTEAQLARKRANDREAQRSIRQRTKDRIERLELRIKELTDGQNDERSFEEVQRRNEELEEELRQMREGMPHYEDNTPYSNRSLRPEHLIQMPPRPSYQVPWSLPSVSPGATGVSTSFPTPSFNSVFSGSNYSLSNAGSPLSEMGSASDYFGSFDVEPPQINAPSIASPIGRGRPGIARSVSYPDTNSSSQTQAWSPSPFGFMGIDENLASCNSVMSSMQNARPRRLSSISSCRPSTTSITSMPGSFTKLSSRADSISSSHSMVNSFSHSSRHGSLSSSPALSLTTPTPIIMADGPQAIHQLPMNLPPNSPQTSLQIPYQTPKNNSSSPMHISQPDNRLPTMSSPLSSSLPQLNSSFVNQPSLHPWELPLNFLPPTGPVDALLIGILQRQRSIALSGTTGEELTGPSTPSLQALIHPTKSNKVHPVSSVLSNLLQRTALRGLPEKVAALFIIYRLMQWQIAPTQESYNNLPEWYRPRSSQFITPHPVWASKVIWGKLRDIVIMNQGVYATDEFRHVYSASLNVNWPYREQDVVMVEQGEVRLSEGFREHVLQQENWSLDEGFFRRYPELRGSCRLTGSMDVSE